MRDKREKWTRVRIRLIGSFFAVFFAIVAARAFYLQIIKKDEWVKLAEKQHRKIVPLTPARGTIYDSTGASLAVSVEMDSCFADPEEIDNIRDTAARLSPVLGVPREQLEKKLAGSRNFVWLQRQITPDLVRRIKDLGIEGVDFVKETRRFYPNSEIAAHVIGFTGLDPQGLEGIELKYNSTILGNTGYMVTERDALGRDIALKGLVVKKSSKGANIVLTLDKNIQYIAEKELAKAVVGCRANDGIAVVMEPQTGRVLAMANYPTFNPNSFRRYPSQSLRNRAVADSFEPGSTMKVFLIASALEEKVVGPNDSFNCENGSYSIGGRTIHDTHKYGTLKVSEILKYSSNIGAAKIGARLGQERLYSYLKSFGFGSRTGIELPGEISGLLKERSHWYGIDLATISFGQGISVSALQLAAAVSAVANGGTLMKPYLVDRIIDNDGVILQQSSPQVRQRVISPQTARTLTRMMEGVTDEGGTGVKASVEGYEVAGKTGTAQKVDPLTRSYSASKRIGSFIGFVPADHPRLTILVVIDEPKTSSYGGVVAAPAFSEIALQSLCYLKVAPSKAVTAKAKKPVEENAHQAEQAPVFADEAVIEEGSGGTTMPNFQGMSMRQVLRIMGKSDLNVKLIGSGRAVEQNPRPGQRILPSDQVWVKFSPSA
ncbi:MAG TPA: penicillin-binding protein [Geobacteraceae bacterium]|nr:penicillin-binding protein [Geobacteraceae bacterium]